MSKVYRTSKGQNLDIGALLLSNENTRAVGNMGVNARGDKINSENKTVRTRNESMDQHYRKTYSKHVKDEPVYKSAKAVREAQANQPVQEQPVVEKTVEPAPTLAQEPIKAQEPEPQKVPMTGLAGAIAKARSVEQEEEKTLRQMKQEQEGVKRI